MGRAQELSLHRVRDVGGLPGQEDHGAGRGRAVRGLHRRHPHRTLRLRLRWVQRQQQRAGGWSQSSQTGPPRGEVDIYKIRYLRRNYVLKLREREILKLTLTSWPYFGVKLICVCHMPKERKDAMVNDDAATNSTIL